MRVLQEQQFERLGGTETLTVDVRIIAATNRSLDEEVAKGLFRAEGNVREPQNLVERMVILTEGSTVRYADLPSYMLAEPEPSGHPGLGETGSSHTLAIPRKKLSLRDMEKQEIEAALRRHGWVQARAARELGLTQRQIGYRIRKYGLRVPGTQELR